MVGLPLRFGLLGDDQCSGFGGDILIEAVEHCVHGGGGRGVRSRLLPAGVGVLVPISKPMPGSNAQNVHN
jgi:hypothetical protein